MKNIIGHFAAAFCAAVITASAAAVLPDGLHAEAAQQEYLALGDSISAGYGLAAPETEGFVWQVAAHGGYALTNLGKDGNTAAGIYAQISTGEYDALITDAELITITCGGNDLMHLLYEHIADTYNTLYGLAPITAEDVVPVLTGTSHAASYVLVTMAANTALRGFADSAEFDAELALYVENLTAVMEHIRSLNTDGTVIVETQYHPYGCFAGSELSIVDTGIRAGVVKLNAAIMEQAQVLDYLTADVCTAFEASEENLCTATVSPMNLDFHPNAAGHAVIADTFIALLPEECPHIWESGICTSCQEVCVHSFADSVCEICGMQTGVIGNAGFAQSYTYTGEAIIPDAADFTTSNDAAQLTFTWLDASGAPLAKAPVNAGSYQLLVQAPASGNYSAAELLLDVTIAQASPFVAPQTPDAVYTEGDALPELTLSPDSTAGTIHWSEPDTILTAGENLLEWTFSPEDAFNYTHASGSLTITAQEAAVSGVTVLEQEEGQAVRILVTEEDGSQRLYLLYAIDSLDYTSAGFSITSGGSTVNWETATVYESIRIMGKTYAASDFGGSYLIALCITDLPEDAAASTTAVPTLTAADEQPADLPKTKYTVTEEPEKTTE
ncbi:MAG: hypothetical protein IJ265_12695 [Oscillospiraceae bacterium]|nr:hypothetical protein [Oscillospiraceae bacterium]